MESKNLNDIVIDDNSDSKKAQLKNILTLLALLFIILVISIVITRIILGDDNDTKLNATNTNGVSEITQQNIESNSSFISENGADMAKAALVGAAGGAIASKVISSKNREEHVNSRNTLRETAPEKEVTKTVIRKAPEVHKEYKETKKVVHHTPRPKRVIHKNYYIKVGIFKDPSNAINMINEKGGLHYTTKKTSRGTTIVLVGPYASKRDAEGDLDKVKEIVPDAFIKKIN